MRSSKHKSSKSSSYSKGHVNSKNGFIKAFGIGNTAVSKKLKFISLIVLTVFGLLLSLPIIFKLGELL